MSIDFGRITIGQEALDRVEFTFDDSRMKYTAEVESFTSRLAREVARAEDEHIRSVLRQVFKAGEAKGYTQGLYDGSALGDPDAEPSFDEWLANFIAMNQEDRA